MRKECLLQRRKRRGIFQEYWGKQLGQDAADALECEDARSTPFDGTVLFKRGQQREKNLVNHAQPLSVP